MSSLYSTLLKPKIQTHGNELCSEWRNISLFTQSEQTKPIGAHLSLLTSSVAHFVILGASFICFFFCDIVARIITSSLRRLLSKEVERFGLSFCASSPQTANTYAAFTLPFNLVKNTHHLLCTEQLSDRVANPPAFVFAVKGAKSQCINSFVWSASPVYIFHAWHVKSHECFAQIRKNRIPCKIQSYFAGPWCCDS